MERERNIAAIILAAGKGKRMQSKTVNKVAMQLGDKPMIQYGVHLLENMKFEEIVVVVGFAKESVMKVLNNLHVLFATQQKRLGTAHAAWCGLKKLSPKATDVLVLYGDDSAFYSADALANLIELHFQEQADMTLLTIEVENPHGLGRIVRDNAGNIIAIVEDKDATEEQKKISEVNPACYIFRVDFLKKYLPKVRKSPVSGEYYLTSLIDLAMKNGKKIAALPAGKIAWRGVNTKEELALAEQIFHSMRNPVELVENK